MIRKTAVVSAPVEKVWEAWTTGEGAAAFFAPEARIELAPGGRYEMLFDLEAPEGTRGSEGCRVLSFLPPEMLSFEWNAPPEFARLRGVKTWVVVQLEPKGADGTEVTP